MDPSITAANEAGRASVALTRSADPPISTLTPREIEVLRLMAEGLSTKEVARALKITFKTAASHRGRILAKLGAHESISAVRWAIRVGLVEP
jgi:DNA-binding NarL/FixJ family response regulator